ncbi:MAG: 1-acyl-sn-glycerol-3-phosphate acyltransferase [Bacteroidaceae bacterium]|nr:1-acyl-sn-glycerol-3-phosphate acyltransferase [Bacteroidaceae bacterium]
MKRKIQDGGRRYFFTKFFVDWAVRTSYRKFQIEGLENLPKDGSVIWAANHTNALMDPLVMLAATPEQKVYVARADIFKKKSAVKWLNFLKIMPIYRIRDGIDAVKKNDEAIAIATDVLLDGVPFVIYPEATHRPKHSLLKLSKGIFHIALSVCDRTQEEKPVYIMPIGIEYGDYFRFRSTVLVNFGKPFNVTQFVKDNADLPQPVQMVKMRELLTQKMADQIVYVPDDEDYDATWEYAKLIAGNPHYFHKTLRTIEKERGTRLKGLLRNQAVDRKAVEEIQKLKADNPQKARELLDKVEKLRIWRIQNGVSVNAIANSKRMLAAHINLLLALIGLPYYIFCGIVGSIMWIPILLILRGIKDDAFYNTVRFATRFAMLPIATIIWAVLYFCLLPWTWALALFILSIPSLRYLYGYGAFFRRLCSDIRWFWKRGKAPEHDFVWFHED